MVPVEMLGYVEFPHRPAALSPHSRPVWFFVAGAAWYPRTGRRARGSAPGAGSEANAVKGWAGLIPDLEAKVLPEYLPRQRWFGPKSRHIRKVQVADWAEFAGAALMVLDVDYDSGPGERYFAPLIAKDGAVQDALQDDAFCKALLTLTEVPFVQGKISGQFAAQVSETAPFAGGAKNLRGAE
jgi:maltose alpha-D-glucosyltransferase / alpha-amylase